MISWLFPKKCLSCETLIEEDGYFCDKCMKEWPGIPDLHCMRCYFPLGSELSQVDRLCSQCRASTGFCTEVGALGLYKGILEKLIGRFKFQGEEELSIFFGSKISEIISSFADDIDLILPVPLHVDRLRERGYNQSVLVSRIVSEKTKIPHDLFNLKKVKSTPAQSLLSGEARRINLEGSFEIKNGEAIKGKRVLIIDDVFTTGTTLEVASRVLMDVGAKSVRGFVIARAA